jgi:hypothetical protein
MSADDYADYLFFNYASSSEFDERFGFEWKAEDEVKAFCRQAMREVFARRGYSVGTQFDDLADTNLSWLVQRSAMTVEGDAYTGTYYKLLISTKSAVVASFTDNSGVGRRIEALGDFALNIALSRLAQEQGWQPHDNSLPLYEFNPSVQALASDRVVLFSDNQRNDFEGLASEVIDAVSAQNHVSDESGIRELIIGQLKAGRELIRAGCTRLYLLELTLIQTLRFLVKRYEREAIAGLAAALITALVKHIGIDA